MDKRTLQQQQELYWEYAEDKGSLGYILFSPYLLWRWQHLHKKDLMRVATIASHKLGKHVWCRERDKCVTVEKFLIQHQSPPDLFLIKEHFQTKFVNTLVAIHALKVLREPDQTGKS